jgi:large-conductance mechanosensitive channel
MLLRRVIQHVRQQEWIAIFIDFLIVVFGVFIGIQVANWNQAQTDKRLGETFIERLSNDFMTALGLKLTL